MAIVRRMVSDITGTEAPESDFLSLTVRSHPAITEPKQLDVLPDEVDTLKEATDLVVLEIRTNGDIKQVVMTLAEFRKLCPDNVVQDARGTRGRKIGWSPKDSKSE